jgi:hypothetical protein
MDRESNKFREYNVYVGCIAGKFLVFKLSFYWFYCACI